MKKFTFYSIVYFLCFILFASCLCLDDTNDEIKKITVCATVDSKDVRNAFPGGIEYVYYASLHAKTVSLDSNSVLTLGTVSGNTVTFEFEKIVKVSDLLLEIFVFDKNESSKNVTTAFFHGQTEIASLPTSYNIVVSGIVLEKNSYNSANGTVELSIKIPSGYNLLVDDTANFKIEGTSESFTLKNNSSEGLSPKSYPVNLFVTKNEKIIYSYQETIYVFPGMKTNSWKSENLENGALKIETSKISTIFYVRGSDGTWYSKIPASFSVAAGSDSEGNGSLAKPYATIKTALEKIIAINDSTTLYSIYVDGKILAESDKDVVNLSGVSSTLNLKIKGLDSSQRAILQGNGKSVVCQTLTTKTVNLTLENVEIKGGSGTYNAGGGIYFVSSSDSVLNLKNVKVDGNTVTSYGAGIYANTATVNIENSIISNNYVIGSSLGGAGFYIDTNATVNITNSDFTGNKCVESAGSENYNANGGGVYNNGTLKMNGSTISGNNALSGGGIYNNGTFEMSGAAYIPVGDGKNDVYLPSGKYITITGALTGTSPVATIKPASDTDGTQVLAVDGTNVTALTQAICDQFALSDTIQNFEIQPNSTDSKKGVLKNLVVSAGGIEIEIPNFTGYTATLSLSSPAFGASVTFTLKKNSAAVTPSSCTMALYTSDDLATPITTSSATSITIPTYLSALGNKNFKVRIVAYDAGVLILDDYYDITVQ